ncbi:5-methyltetrahydropteroyltriglutamate--homocysteine S-methyltransferase [Streptomyces xiaopingdaonensis]|uniref:5-methyltetrahydropteroyltriglutamate-- homocysteine S-methyltransferase n=1 Tax=Streptomyces xiaopingdaonensis TaxID=1565415 RepID=UPI0002D6FF18|nr:5-methyltetrahydropteroyltriglutamate--homocysteine S-methyltransferase [Streptomyces xiaopingdaonensis]
MATRTSLPPFRADHVGSLLRPEALKRARAEYASGALTAEQLGAAEDAAVRDVVRRQHETGLRTVTDGEFRRSSWHMDFIYGLGGVTRVDDTTVDVTFHNESGDVAAQFATARVDGRIRLDDVLFGDAFAFLRDNAPQGTTPKLTIPSPSMVHYRGGRSAIDQEVYPDLDAFWTDLTAAYAAEIRGVHRLGCRYLQLDDTSLAYLNDPEQRAHVAELGGDPAHQHETYIANINRALRDRPADLRVTTHLCRGNFASSWAASGSYDYVAEALFGGLDVDGFFLEFDDARSGGFEPLRYVPAGKQVVLGLVTSKRPELESNDALKRRIDEAARYVDADQLCLSPQCGFSSTQEGNNLTQEEQFAKLRLIVETAEEVWGGL